MRRPLPRAFYANALAGGLFFAAVFVPQHLWHLVLQWLGGLALLCAIVLLIIGK